VTTPCPRPECGGEVHTDGWGTPIRCPHEGVACCLNCGHEAAIAELAQAIRLTREYVGEELLPPIEGWSWYDALRRHAPHELPASEEPS
jgi:hypothetical protein